VVEMMTETRKAAVIIVRVVSSIPSGFKVGLGRRALGRRASCLFIRRREGGCLRWQKPSDGSRLRLPSCRLHTGSHRRLC
jgi:hypothetical protein